MQSLGYAVVPYGQMGNQSGVVVCITGSLKNMAFPEGRYGAYSVGVDLSYRCTMTTKKLTGQATVSLGPLAVGSYSFISYSGQLNFDEFKRIELETISLSIKKSNVLQVDASICNSLKTVGNSATKTSKK